ncbi:cobalamin biosynthesis protein [Actinoplanes siamensis]|uniref:CobE/GbiG C-terminal domain-containing protein n=1 Tax=Actinoplanes siamensis TaxID=1223317 RepID=A0A919MX47_9ACTN|nr:cobalamin biosynthesis protein [Actinoplanes siamensis]GIF03177.1 hypothetical protein Asi03nite_07150 [Actinoplanes siamensis]
MIFIGVGARRGAAVVAAIEAALAQAGVDRAEVGAVATLDRRSFPDVGWPVVTFRAEQLAARPVPTPSARVAAAVGTPSVAEAAALLAAGPSAELIMPKRIFGGVTVALARSAPGPG